MDRGKLEPTGTLRKQEKPPTLLPSTTLGRLSPTTLAALERLCSMKNQTQFTPHAAETWAAALSVYDEKDVNRALIEQGLSTDPFPDLSKIMIRCETVRRERAGTVPQNGVTKVSDGAVTEVAALFGIEV